MAGQRLALGLQGRLEVVVGDITEDDSEAIVNAANSSLMGGGGVDGAIHEAGGPSILEECQAIRKRDWPQGLPAGKAVVTGGGRMKAKHVIHTVGPRYSREGGRENELLAQAYRNSLTRAEEMGLKTIAFPAISTGIYGFPKGLAGRVVAGVMEEWLNEHPDWQRIRLHFRDEEDAEIFMRHSGLELERGPGLDGHERS
jgi:O-acetyl-ADP-ribose deacetylase (regulator of RNase III)